MTRYILPVAFLLFLLAAFRPAQYKEKDDPYTHLDTLKFYRVNLSARIDGKRETYTVNRKEITKAQYDVYKASVDNIGKCTPCYLRSYSENDSLLSEGVQYTDCCVGDWKEFYPDGKLKVKGHYKENHTGNWKNIYNRGYCSVKDGDWLYLSPKGDTLKQEHYENGTLTK